MLDSYKPRRYKGTEDFDKRQMRVRGGIYAPKEVPSGDKGGCTPPCSCDKEFSLAGDTLFAFKASGLMAEVAEARVHHHQAELVGRGDDFLVAHAAAGLDDGLGAGLGDHIHAVAEREEGVGRDERAR